jgi:tetratricopeptide (TPR) repeat protein
MSAPLRLRTVVAPIAFVLFGAVAPSAAAPTNTAAVDRLIDQATTLIRTGDLTAASRILKSLERQNLPRDRRITVLRRLGNIAFTEGRLDDSLAIADSAETLARAANDYSALTNIEADRCRVWRDRDAPRRELETARRALTWAERSGNHEALATAYGFIAQSYQDLQDWTRSLDYIQRAYDAQPDPLRRLPYLLMRANAYTEFRERDQAEQNYREALAVARALKDPRECVALYELGYLYWRFDRDQAKALDYYRQGLALAQRNHDLSQQVDSLNGIGGVWRDVGNPL